MTVTAAVVVNAPPVSSDEVELRPAPHTLVIVPAVREAHTGADLLSGHPDTAQERPEDPGHGAHPQLGLIISVSGLITSLVSNRTCIATAYVFQCFSKLIAQPS